MDSYLDSYMDSELVHHGVAMDSEWTRAWIQSGLMMESYVDSHMDSEWPHT